MVSHTVISAVALIALFLVRVGLPIGLVMTVGYWIQRRMRVEEFSVEPPDAWRTGATRAPWLLQSLAREIHLLPAWLPTVALFTTVGTAAIVYRLATGLGASTHLSQSYPWGLWIGVTLFMIAFSSGTFALPVIVYVLNLDQFRAGLRPTILAGLLGYASVTLTMIMGLGHWERVLYLLAFPNTSSPLTLCFWCIMLYSVVLLIEFIPVGSDQKRPSGGREFLKRFSVVLAIMGATLALSFQFSLGTVFIIASQRVHPMWHTPILPAIFLASSIIAGLAMVIAGGTASSWIFGRSLSQDLVGKLVTWVPWALGLYLLVLFVDLFFVQDPILTWGVPSLLYMTELVVGTLIPLFIFTKRWVRDSRGWSFVGAAMILFGVLVNRLDVAWLSTASASGVIYMPSLMEIVIQMGVICVIILVYTLVGHYLPLFEGLSATKPHAAENLGVKPAL